LKQHMPRSTRRQGSSRPARGAWIETLGASCMGNGSSSRPARGAWIETRRGLVEIHPPGRAPRGARGLKPAGFGQAPAAAPSRPARGAWIETSPVATFGGTSRSRPARGAWIETPPPGRRHRARGARGLKQQAGRGSGDRSTSRPARGAWIETRHDGVLQCGVESRPARGAWIETLAGST